VALITTLLVIALLVAVIVEFNRMALADIELTNIFQDQKKILFLSISGANTVREFLRLDGLFTESDNLLEDWAGGRAWLESANNAIEEGFIEGQITDENGKVNVNGLVNAEGEFQVHRRAILERLLKQDRFNLSDDQIFTIIYGIKDWIDPDNEVTGIYGAESGHYQNKGYRCKNKPLFNLDELLLVRGVTEKIFFGSDRQQGIRPFLSVYGGDRININTAPVPVLMALTDQMTEDIAVEIDRFRRDDANQSLLKNPDWYKKVWPFQETFPESLITTKSNHFTLYLKCRLGDSVKTVRVVISRGLTKTSILSWWEM
jgi:general secretion pathway protein K